VKFKDISGRHQMKRLSLFVFLVFVIALFTTTQAQPPDSDQAAPVGTLVPPTLVPLIDTGEGEGVVAESGIARIMNTGRVRVGILANQPPFGELNVRGDWNGFDADLGRALAEIWGVEVRFKQVTNQTGLDQLDRREVDMLIAGQVHQRNLDDNFEFSQTYYLGSQSVMVKAGETAPKTLAELANRRIGVTMATDAEAALTRWMQQSGVPVTPQQFTTLDQAYNALMNDEVDAIAANRYQLSLIAPQPELIAILEEPLELEPYAIAMPRQDVSLRNLVNKTLQYLRQNGRLAEIRQVHFPESDYEPAVWDALGEEAPKPDQFPVEVSYPTQYVVPRLEAERVLRVAIPRLPEGDDIPQSAQRLDTFYRSLMDEFGRRWQVQIEYVAVDDPTQGLEAVANGQADVAVGVQPSWDWDERVDFTDPYLLHGLRLLVPKNGSFFGFRDLAGGRFVAFSRDDPEIVEIIRQEAEEANARVETLETREQDFALQILEEDNADVAFADSIVLLPHVEQYPDDLEMTTEWYTEEYVVMATPRNDIDFRLLTEYTLQELVRDGTLERLLGPVMLPEDVPNFDIWPGEGNYFGFNITGQ
jgi:ABC-type amino acid transport substrate-binding protein